ncbi:DUF1800 domain-containing protein [Humitalea sp. 24SJ18S-53]|uniref:DUF1800 domain-containing protein n=1 Tax=Humitalea sp. 24SJ18S-53 TaxID=3422307 RepID=UPI003D67AC10
MIDARAIIAASRFGLGPRPDQPPPADPEAWLLAQLGPPGPPPPVPGFDTPPSVLDGLTAWREDERNPPPPGTPYPRNRFQDAERDGWAIQRLTTDQPFRERLVAFWANHLTVSRREGFVAVLGGPYLRDVIRPHVTGRFADMLVASAKHPAMLIYLNGNASIGPDSPWGKRSGRGLNENLGREILELHSLSPAGGYSQADVTAFAMLLTGLSVETTRDPLGYLFRPSNHQPGIKQVMGRDFGDGEAAIEEALRWLANHPATHRHLATKLARHFVADDPPPAAVAKLEGVLRDTQGDLGAVSRALVALPEAWSTPLSKLRDADDYMTAAARALGAGPDMGRNLSNWCASLNQGMLYAPGPNGCPDRAEAWGQPEGALGRLDLLHGLTGRYSRVKPDETLDLVLGPLARDATRTAIGRAGSARDALTLLLGSPEFQRR